MIHDSYMYMLHLSRVSDETKYVQPDAANFNSWRRHIRLVGDPPDNIVHAWEDVKVREGDNCTKKIGSYEGNKVAGFFIFSQ